MRIAQIAPLAESVPPRLHGGTERVVSYLTEELVRLGHDVTLFASGDSVTAAEQRAHEFDVLHFHIDHVHLPLFRTPGHKRVTTVHSRLDLPEAAPLFREFREMPLVSVSDAQRRPIPGANWVGTVYHGLPAEVCPLNPSPPRGAARYLAFLGRASPDTGLEEAIRLSRLANVRLRVAARVDDAHYFRERIAPLLRQGAPVELIGEVDDAAKPGFLGRALALLFPAAWPEPFGLAMIEAMSCGTPVIARSDGAAPEIVDEGITGFIVDSTENALEAVERAGRLDRMRVRERFDERFSAARMARDYLAIYRALGRAQPLRAVRP